LIIFVLPLNFDSEQVELEADGIKNKIAFIIYLFICISVPQ